MKESGEGYKVQINQKFGDILINIYDNKVDKAVKNFKDLKNELGLEVEKDAKEVLKEIGIEEIEPTEKTTIPVNKVCPLCGTELKFVAAGISKKTGKSYKAFFSCENPICKYTQNIQ
jgi:uncharacterized protein with PIN domain